MSPLSGKLSVHIFPSLWIIFSFSFTVSFKKEVFLSLASHQLLLILRAGFSRDRQQWKCDEITAAVLCFKAQDLDRLGTRIKYSEG